MLQDLRDFDYMHPMGRMNYFLGCVVPSICLTILEGASGILVGILGLALLGLGVVYMLRRASDLGWSTKMKAWSFVPAGVWLVGSFVGGFMPEDGTKAVVMSLAAIAAIICLGIGLVLLLQPGHLSRPAQPRKAVPPIVPAE